MKSTHITNHRLSLDDYTKRFSLMNIIFFVLWYFTVCDFQPVQVRQFLGCLWELLRPAEGHFASICEATKDLAKTVGFCYALISPIIGYLDRTVIGISVEDIFSEFYPNYKYTVVLNWTFVIWCIFFGNLKVFPLCIIGGIMLILLQIRVWVIFAEIVLSPENRKGKAIEFWKRRLSKSADVSPKTICEAAEQLQSQYVNNRIASDFVNACCSYLRKKYTAQDKNKEWYEMLEDISTFNSIWGTVFSDRLPSSTYVEFQEILFGNHFINTEEDKNIQLFYWLSFLSYIVSCVQIDHSFLDGDTLVQEILGLPFKQENHESAKHFFYSATAVICWYFFLQNKIELPLKTILFLNSADQLDKDGDEAEIGLLRAYLDKFLLNNDGGIVDLTLKQVMKESCVVK